MSAVQPLTRRSIFTQAWPIMLGQASIPLVGIVDAAVIGRTGDAAALAGVALGATVVTMLFWSFGFLRMGLTGLTSQAQGRGKGRDVQVLLLHGLLIGLSIGGVLVLLRGPLLWLAFSILSGGEDVTREAGLYAAARLFGAPAALCVYAINGWLLGLGRTRQALVLQIVMNVVNIVADVTLVTGFNLGAMGVGLGTAIAEYAALLTGLLLAGRVLGGPFLGIMRALPRSAIMDRAAIARLFSVNRDIMIRTLALLTMFTWFANAGARLGTVQLAANHVLMQFISLAAFVLDAFAFTAESRVGMAIGAGDRARFLRSIRLTAEFSLGSGAALCLLFLAAGPRAIEFIASDAQVRAEAMHFLPFAALIPLIGMPSWLLDGVFIGATNGRALRNAAVLATAAYLALDYGLRPLGNPGVWIAFTAGYLLRAVSLGLFFPGMLRGIECGSATMRVDGGTAPQDE